MASEDLEERWGRIRELSSWLTQTSAIEQEGASCWAEKETDGESRTPSSCATVVLPWACRGGCDGPSWPGGLSVQLARRWDRAGPTLCSRRSYKHVENHDRPICRNTDANPSRSRSGERRGCRSALGKLPSNSCSLFRQKWRPSDVKKDLTVRTLLR